VRDCISFCQAIPSHLELIDIVTNSGHLRPITSDLISRLPANAVIALMFEAWEMREGDIDISACRKRGIRIVGVNERHPDVDVFSYLGPLCVSQLQSAGLPVYRNRIAILSDNDFGLFIKRTLGGLGAETGLFEQVSLIDRNQWDCVVIALYPRSEPRIGPREARILSSRARNALIAQFWGDVDRNALMKLGFRVSPVTSPKPGHMAVLLSNIGPEPIIRLQSAGLKAAEHAHRGGAITRDGIAQLV
jgi:predicted Fe-Mo cluster-binding NifX family protein